MTMSGSGGTGNALSTLKIVRAFTRGVSAVVVALLLTAMAFAGPYEDAEARYRAGDYRGALALLQQAQQLTPDDPRVYAAQGKTYRRLNDNAAAVQAYSEVLRLDPRLNSIKDKQGFLKAYQQLGGKIPAQTGSSGTAGSQRGGDASLLVNALAGEDVYVVPTLMGSVDKNAIAAEIEAARPTSIKVLVVQGLGPYPSREAMADDLRRRLDMPSNGIVIVATPRGVSASSASLSRSQFEEAFQKAGIDQAKARGGLTAAIVAAIDSVTGKQVSERRRANGNAAGLIGAGLLGVGGFLGYRAYRKRKAIADAKESVEPIRRRVLEHLSYADGYLDLLPKGEDGEEAKRLRASAFEKFDTANGVLKNATNPEDIRKAAPLLERAEAEMLDCRKAIDRATGGTGVVMGLSEMPDLSTTTTRGQHYLRTEELRTESERRAMQEEIESIPPDQRGVSFFSGQPLPASELVPVTLVIQGQKRTVMASREEAAAIARGETPQIRAFRDESGNYVPWYERRDYDPYRDYYGNRGMFSGTDFISLYLLSQMMGPGLYGGYGPWGYGGYGWGMPTPPPTWGGWGYGGYGYGGYSGSYGGGYDNGSSGYAPEPQYDATPENAGGFDFFGTTQSEQGGFDGGSDDNSGGWFGGGGDSGGFDLGGGGDVGGGDFGGGGDW